MGDMDPAFFSAFAALAGSAIGGLTSLAATWLTQHSQYRAQQRTREQTRREDLYRSFIEEAAKWHAHAYGHETAEVTDLVNLYALVNRMRVLSSPAIVDEADKVVRVILETYRAPKKTILEAEELLDDEAMNPLREFSNACREELRGEIGV